jgi:hypothetical protein
MKDFLNKVGRVRANEIELLDDSGYMIYNSPPPVYKAGRDAPAWYSNIVSPAVKTQEIELEKGRLLVRADPSRAVLDGWDDFVPLLVTILFGMVSGMLPVVGVPLPFISYGGTAMVTLGLGLGILMSVAKAKQLVQS